MKLIHSLPVVALALALSLPALASERVPFNIDEYRKYDGMLGGIGEINVYLRTGIRARHRARQDDYSVRGDVQLDRHREVTDIDITSDTPGVILGKVEHKQYGFSGYWGNFIHVTFDPNCKSEECAMTFSDMGGVNAFRLVGFPALVPGTSCTEAFAMGDAFGWLKFELSRERGTDFFYHHSDHAWGVARSRGDNYIELETEVDVNELDQRRVRQLPGVQR